MTHPLTEQEVLLKRIAEALEAQEQRTRCSIEGLRDLKPTSRLP